MANIFNSVKLQKVKGNRFDLSHDVKMTTKMGQLTPVFIQEVIPGDKFKIRSENLIRFAPLIAPVMHNINVSIHYFFVPNRLVWPNWEKFITANNGEEVVPAPPTNAQTMFEGLGSLGDYLGCPTNIQLDPGEVSLIPFAAYQKIYNEYYRDQNLIEPVKDTLTDGQTNNYDTTTIRTRAWEHDYFTAALPFAQKGDAVSLPITNGKDVMVYAANGFGSSDIPTASGSTSYPNVKVQGREKEGDQFQSYLYADTSELNANAATINDLRRAFRLQEWLEKMARGGSRYIEQTLMHFGVRSSDARLNRPEFIGGQRQKVVVSEVLQTGEATAGETPLATMAGHAISASSGKDCSYTSEEHGYIIGIMSIMPSSSYSQGLPRHLSRKSYLDYAWPTFAHIGEQEIKNKEVMVTTDKNYNEGVFGYIPRYSEYRFAPSRYCGEFRGTLDFWHLGRKFDPLNPPQLNKQFVECFPRNDIFAVPETDNQNIWLHVRNQVSAFRKLPKYGTPTL